MVTFEEQNLVDELATLVRWSSDRPAPVSFRVYRDGEYVDGFLSEAGVGEYLVTGVRGEQVFLDVLDLDAAIPEPAFPPTFDLNWQGDVDAERYTVEELVDAAWVERQVLDSGGLAAFEWETRRLEDCTDHQFRITPIHLGGGEGTALELAAKMVRIPDAPSVTYSVAGGVLTVIED